MDLPLLDEAFFQIAKALVDMKASRPVLDTLADLVTEAKSADWSPLITDLLPAIHGVCRALQCSQVMWSDEHLDGATKLAMAIELTTASQATSTSKDGFYAECMLVKYAEYGYTVEPTLVRDILLATAAAMWEQAVLGSRLETFISSGARPSFDLPVSNSHTNWVAKMAMDLHVALQDNRSIGTPAYSKFQHTSLASCETLKLGFLGSRIVPGLQQQATDMLLAAAETDQLRQTALILLIAAVKLHPTLADTMAQRVRSWLLNRASVYGPDAYSTNSRTFLSRLYITCTEAVRSKDGIISNAYALLNLLPVRSGNSAASFASGLNAFNGLTMTSRDASFISDAQSSPDLRSVTQALLAAVVDFARHFSSTREVVELCISVLLQRARSLSPIAEEGDVLAALAELAAFGTDDEFTDTAKTLVDLSGQENSGVVVGAMTKLAGAAEGDADRAEGLLTHALRLFVAKAVASRRDGAAISAEQRTFLLGLVAVAAKVLPIRSPADYSEELQILLQNFWFLTSTLGLAASPTDATDWHAASFGIIAVNTPCLIRGTHVAYFDTELEYSSVLRAISPGHHVRCPFRMAVSHFSCRRPSLPLITNWPGRSLATPMQSEGCLTLKASLSCRFCKSSPPKPPTAFCRVCCRTWTSRTWTIAKRSLRPCAL
jgi:hypothetical protein